MWYDVSLDRLTVVGHYTRAVATYIKREVPAEDVLIGGPLYHYRFRPVFGGFVELNPSSEGGQVRFDYNPNELRSAIEAMRFIRWMRGNVGGVRPTRVDIALDYHDNPHLPTANWIDERPRKVCVWRGRLGQLESIYFGAPSSQLRIRVYDKALEQREEGNWWRVEAQVRISSEEDWEDAIRQPFAGIYAVQANVSGLSVQELAMLDYSSRNPEAMGLLDKKTRAKYRLLRRQVGVITPVPADLWERRRAHIYDVIRGWIEGPELLDDNFGHTYFQELTKRGPMMYNGEE
jgi:hypothetical protein